MFLHGCADGTDTWVVSEREKLDASPAIRGCARIALDMAGKKVADVDAFDLYSCFPSAVEVAMTEIGIPENDPRPISVTGGLPFFGGPGNNYVTHSIAEMMNVVRAKPGSFGMVTANGNYLTKHSAGLYSTEPTKGAVAARGPEEAPGRARRTAEAAGQDQADRHRHDRDLLRHLRQGRAGTRLHSTAASTAPATASSHMAPTTDPALRGRHADARSSSGRKVSVSEAGRPQRLSPPLIRGKRRKKDYFKKACPTMLSGGTDRGVQRERLHLCARAVCTRRSEAADPRHGGGPRRARRHPRPAAMARAARRVSRSWNRAGDSVYGLARARAGAWSTPSAPLLGGPVYHYQSKLTAKEPEVGGAWEWHQDYGYWYYNGCLRPDLLSVMIALDKTTPRERLPADRHRLAPARPYRPHAAVARPRTRSIPSACRISSRSAPSSIANSKPATR